MTSSTFVKQLEAYFGPWRGDRTGAVIQRWLDKHSVPERLLDEVYVELVETRDVEPVNTISIADLRSAIQACPPQVTDAPQIEGPSEEYVPREEGVKRLRGILERLAEGSRI